MNHRVEQRLPPLAMIALSCALSLAAMSCDGGEVRSGSTDSMTYDMLVERLADTGITVQAETTTVDQPWTDVHARHLRVEDELLQVFDYPSETVAEREANRISPDGTAIGPHRVEWVEPAHFYRVDRFVVLYLGRNETVQETLTAVLGPPFAGPEIP